MTSSSAPPSLHGPLTMDDDDDTMDPPAFDVGVVIAKKKKAQQQQEEQESKTVSSPKNLSSSSSLRDFIYGASIYVACLAIPTLLGITGFFESGEKDSTTTRLDAGIDPKEQSYYYQASQYVCENLWSYWCYPEPQEDSVVAVGVHAPDAEWTDVGIVAALSLSMAVIRLLLVHLLVPLDLAPNREALVRCKSVHLLSSTYPTSLTPQSSKKKLSTEGMDALPAPPLFAEKAEEDELSSSLHGVKQSIESVLSSGQRSARRVLGVEPKAPYDGDERLDTDRLFTAPRYATAVFRLVYCMWTCTCAFLWLCDEEFMPRAMGGSGATRNCWDLKGGVALETSADFDNANAVLRKYFLVQASYHLHSWATHCMSLLALWWYGTTFVSIRKSMVSYWRPLLQHLLALAMIAGCYFFSSLRRLGAIGIFALDISSLFIHALQLCINAPPGKWFHSPTVIAWVHRGLVIPIFLYTRFYVFPFVVWYSAIFESKDWLQQMERTLVPGTANAMKMVFHAFLLVNLVLNLVAFRRLLFHPHLHSVTSRKNLQGEVAKDQ